MYIYCVMTHMVEIRELSVLSGSLGIEHTFSVRRVLTAKPSHWSVFFLCVGILSYCAPQAGLELRTACLLPQPPKVPRRLA